MTTRTERGSRQEVVNSEQQLSLIARVLLVIVRFLHGSNPESSREIKDMEKGLR